MYRHQSNILNLSSGFTPFGDGCIEDVSKPFPSGVEPNIRLQAKDWFSLQVDLPLWITLRPESQSDILRLMLAVDALRRMEIKNPIKLFLSYLPCARQDRVTASGEAFALKIVADIINSLMLDEVVLFDVHSIVATGLIHRSHNVEPMEFFKTVISHHDSGVQLVIPDAGAASRVGKLIKGYTIDPAQCLKKRENGEITGIRIFDVDSRFTEFLIFDDICDGGATFIAIAKVLREVHGATYVGLATTHGIYSRGVEHLKNNGIDGIHTTDSFCKGMSVLDQNFHVHPIQAEWV